MEPSFVRGPNRTHKFAQTGWKTQYSLHSSILRPTVESQKRRRNANVDNAADIHATQRPHPGYRRPLLQSHECLTRTTRQDSHAAKRGLGNDFYAGRQSHNPHASTGLPRFVSTLSFRHPVQKDDCAKKKPLTVPRPPVSKIRLTKIFQ